MNRDVFLNLLSRKLSNELSESGSAELEKAARENEEFAALDKSLSNYSPREPVSTVQTDRHLQKVWERIGIQDSEHVQPKKTISLDPLVWKIAAAVLVFLTAGLLYTYLPGADQMQMAEVRTGNDKLFITLDDGTSVWLNKNSSLRYNEAFGQKVRKVELSGEAFFDVAKNPAVPMNIEAGKIIISVKGTAFNVQAYQPANSVVVALVRGLVEVFDRDNQQNRIALKPNQQLLYSVGQSEGSKFSISDIHMAGSLSKLQWRNDSLVFRKEKFRNLAVQLEDKYQVKIEIRDERLKEKRFSGMFSDEKLSEAMEALKLSYPFQYQIKDKQVIIE